MSEAAVFWKKYESIPSGGIDLLAEAGGIPVQGILCSGDGDLAATHSTPINGDISETIPAVAGQYFPLRANTILDTTTALPLVVFWGYGSGSVITPGTSGGGGGGGDASAANQLDQIAEAQTLNSIVATDGSVLDVKTAVETLAGGQTLAGLYGQLSDISAHTPALVNGSSPVTKTSDVWVGERFVKVLFSAMTPSGYTIPVPTGYRVVSILGDKTLSGAQTLSVEAFGNDPGVEIALNFGANYEHLGRWKKIGTTTTNGSFPLWVKMIPA